MTIGLVLAGFATIVPKSFSQNITDNEIKAALVFKFPVYVQWPGNVMNDNTKNLECCVLGKGDISDLLDHFDGAKLMGRIIRVKRISDIGRIAGCHMLFVESSERKSLPMIFKAIEGKAVLTIGNVKGFTQNGGIVNFIRKKDSVHFEINPEAGIRAGLKISSKLLRLAEIVREDNSIRWVE